MKSTAAVSGLRSPSRRPRTLCLFTAACAVLSWGLAGCSSKDDPWDRVAVEGQVTFNGQPLATGVIAFYPIEGTPGPVAGGEIADGRYAIDAEEGPAVGLSRVEIRSVQKTGRLVTPPETPMSDGPVRQDQRVDEFADIIPPRYNSQSTLKFQLVPETVNRIDFNLASEAPAN